jgi:asparagine synthase (glutamine-hydrolysing)
MCGITGVLSFDGWPASTVVLRTMVRAIAHRGPDDEGIFVDGPAGFGHRRLSIIDLSSAGYQPMSTADGRYVIVYNGEIYNYQELRLELAARGCRFHSHTDTEVLLYGFAEWGSGVLDRLNGMFAFAIWDRHERKLCLARDRYGIKPIYYSQYGDLFVFGSEIKAILAHPNVRASLDREGLIEYFTFQNFFTDRTLFKGIKLLPPATLMTIDATTGAISTQQYWDYHFFEAPERIDEEDCVAELRHLFQQAVSRQLVSDVSVSSYLSGGMDSSAITAVAAAQTKGMRSFTIGFDLSSASGLELGFDERARAEQISYYCGTEHYEMVLKAGDMERCLRDLVYHLEEPRVGQSYPNFYAAKLASKFDKVVLAGAGGDELFGGYPWRYYRAVVNDDFEQYVDKYYQFWQRLIPNPILWEVFAPIKAEIGHVSTRDIMRDVLRKHANRRERPEDYINHSLYFEARTFLHGLLVVEDKLSMAHGLETRVPFLDNDLVDFAMRLPVRMKLGNLGEVVRLNENEPGPKTQKFFNQNRDGKLILRKALARQLPDDVTNRIKQGFSAPDASWFRGESINFVRDTLCHKAAPIYDFMDYEAVKSLLDEHLSGRANQRLLIWSLLNVNEWCRRFLGPNPLA